jgi:hypothetical protein
MATYGPHQRPAAPLQLSPARGSTALGCVPATMLGPPADRGLAGNGVCSAVAWVSRFRFRFRFGCGLIVFRLPGLSEQPDGLGFAGSEGVVEDRGGGWGFVQRGGGWLAGCGGQVVGGVDEQPLAGVVEVAAPGPAG